MRFANLSGSPWAIALATLGVLAWLATLAVIVLRARRQRAALALFAERHLHGAVLRPASGIRRVAKDACLLGAMLFALVAAARPQYGKGTRIVPATNLDVVFVVDYSKSMYARDVVPSRIGRVKLELADLIARLGGARFAAVAYAGEPMSFPLTSDGDAIAQFFRQLEPVDMPIGGTATARALELAREMLERDVQAAKHERVVVLLTDGEDEEGDPIEAARQLAGGGTRVHVVRVGGRAPEPLPVVDEKGAVVGWRRTPEGTPLTTELTEAAEKQLAEVAKAGRGKLVEAQKGETGLQVIGDELARTMRFELSEKVETLFAEVYRWPLGAAIVLLALEAMLRERPRTKAPKASSAHVKEAA
jgi:Ca-activated chloride channel family protein